MPRRSSATVRATTVTRTLDARPDTVDFRDLMYVPTLVEVPSHIAPETYLKAGVPVLDQGSEGACTGFGLATVAHYLLRRRKVQRDTTRVSPRMLYELARRHDEWPGEDYSGSSARGAMKGWHRHGVCSDALWPYHPAADDAQGMTTERAQDAQSRPLGAYFRVNHRDLVAMHAALAEVGILYATSMVHEGWNAVGADGRIPTSDAITGAHAYAIVAYDTQGFWLQNSWGKRWGRQGLAHLRYDDWLTHGTDVWVARLGAPVALAQPRAVAAVHAGATHAPASTAYADLRPHVVPVGNDGRLRRSGTYGMSQEELSALFAHDIAQALSRFDTPRILLYAHGGLVSEEAAIQRLAEYRPALLSRGIYPLSFVWRSDYWTTLTRILRDAMRRRRPEGALDAAKDFLLDRVDDAIEPIARALTGKAAWDEMKENALGVSRPGHAGDLVVGHLADLAGRLPGLEIHLVGHSAGSILHAGLLDLLTNAARPLNVRTCTLWAPACTMALFRRHYLPAITRGAIGRLAAYVLDDQTERDDHCARLYNKSLLYLVSHAFEERARIPLLRGGEPLLGLHRDILADAEIRALFESGRADLVITPNAEDPNGPNASHASAHGGFDDDERTVASTLLRILAPHPATGQDETHRGPGTAVRAGSSRRRRPAGLTPAPVQFGRSASSLRAQRRGIDESDA